ncbi:MAG: hypothetical protein KF760_19395 [Candidatus Eremiobacteraeota bacterium]|nr:hypothetical protein [Candidatus Eremiobacteraeota bacterium]MCW5868318.1 hypothetical protein [Candidatus Eremiobacteraeota bacterium]
MNPLVLAGLLLTLAWWLIFRAFPLAPSLVRRALGQLLELLLYGDSPRILGKVWLDLAATSLRLGRALLAPSLVSLLLLLGALQGLESYCRYRPIRVGESFLVSVPAQAALDLSHADGLRLDSPGLFDGQSTCFWRLVATQPGRQWFRPGHTSNQFEVQVGSGWKFLRVSRSGPRIYYPRREFWLGDRYLDWPWLLGLSCLAWLVLGLTGRCCWWLLVRFWSPLSES